MMEPKIRTIQEIVHIPSDSGFDIDGMSDFIDSEIALERRDKKGGTIKVDSVSIVYGDDDDSQLKIPFVHSGTEFRDYIKRLERFDCIR